MWAISMIRLVPVPRNSARTIEPMLCGVSSMRKTSAGLITSTLPPSALRRAAISSAIFARPSGSLLPDSMSTRSRRVSSKGARCA